MSSPKTTQGKCQTCKHWHPMFTGEAWNVRSFSDAPEDARQAIEARLGAQLAADGYTDVVDALGYLPALADTSDSGARSVPGTLDWPYWGECARAEYESDAAVGSLARAADGSEYRAVLRCRCNFGCVQWEEFTSA